MLKYPDISELEGKQIASEICKFAKSNLVQVNIELAYFVGAALFKYWIWPYPLHRITFTTPIMILQLLNLIQPALRPEGPAR